MRRSFAGQAPQYINNDRVPTDEEARDTLKVELELEVERWEDWKNYPKNLEEWNLHEATSKGTTLLAWLVVTFGDSVASQSNARERSSCCSNIFETMTLDDLVFLFLQLQHNISKWNLVWKAYKERHIKAWEEVDDVLGLETDPKKMKGDDESKRRVALINSRGYEFPYGSGVGGRDGRRRYNAIKKFFDDAYYGNDPKSSPEVVQNREALIAAILELKNTMEKEDETLGGGTTSDGGGKKKPSRAVSPPPVKTDVDRIEERGWNDLFRQAEIVQI